MHIDVITTFNQNGYNSYAKRMIESFDQYWPNEINLHIYAENCAVDLKTSPRIHVNDLHEKFPDLVAFKDKYRNNPNANGSKMKDGSLNFKLNHFKWDAVRFSNKVFVVTNCALTSNADILLWLDADTVTFATPTETTLANVLPNPDQYCTYLGRAGKYHSECGWVGYNLKHPGNNAFMTYWKTLYTSGKLLGLREYHDSFVFDEVRRKFELEGKYINKNLTPDLGEKKGPGHPFIVSELGTFMDHVKGKRKERGRSKPEEVLRHKELPYWKKVLGNRNV